MTSEHHCQKCSPSSIYSLELSSNPGFPTNSLEICAPPLLERGIVWGLGANCSSRVFSNFPCPNSPISSHFPGIAELQPLPQASCSSKSLQKHFWDGRPQFARDLFNCFTFHRNWGPLKKGPADTQASVQEENLWECSSGQLVADCPLAKSIFSSQRKWTK